jgi:hypothetical protein
VAGRYVQTLIVWVKRQQADMSVVCADLKGDGQQGRSGQEEFSERWDRFVKSLTAKEEGCTG